MSAEAAVDGPGTYDGPLEIHGADTTLTVEAHLSGFFQPIDGSYRWQGRLQPSAALTDLAVRVGRKEIRVCTPGGAPVTAKLGEVNPWGGYRIGGRGRPPFA